MRHGKVPIVAVAAAIVGVLTVQYMLPPLVTEPGVRFFISFSLVGLAVIAIAFWLLVLSGLASSTRLGAFVVIAAVAVAGVWAFEPEIEFDGEMNPMFHLHRRSRFRETLDAHRAKAAKAVPSPLGEITERDFPEYRNRARDGVVLSGKWQGDWPEPQQAPVWRQPCGGGFAGFAVAGALAVTIEERKANEAVVAYDPETGRERWVHGYPASFSEPLGGNGPRATPTIHGDAVYSVGAKGDFVCLDASTGTLRWRHNLLEGNSNLQWGQCGSPLVVDDLVIVTPGAQTESAAGTAIRAYDRATGKLVWASGNRKAGYSSPQLNAIAGVRQIVLLDGKAVAGFDPKTGAELWHCDWETYQDINVAQPLVLNGDRVFISSGYGHGCAMLRVAKTGDAWTVSELWANKNLRCKFSSPVAREEFIYGLDEAHLVCISAENGERRWKGDRYGFGQILLSGDTILVGAENGRLALVVAKPDKFQELASIRALSGDKNWNHLAVARGHAYLRNHFEMAKYKLPLADQ